MRPVFERGRLAVEWRNGALWVCRDGVAVLVDVPTGTVLGPDAPRLQSIVLTSGRMQAIGGLLPVLAELEPHRRADVPLRIYCPLGEERAPALMAAWSQGWPDRTPLTLDSSFPGAQFEVDTLGFQTFSVRSGEVHWRSGRVDPRVAVALRIVAPEATVAWLPAAAPVAALKRICAGADLAVVEVGVESWPRTRDRWRLSVADALGIGEEAAELWVVGDDGSMGPGDPH